MTPLRQAIGKRVGSLRRDRHLREVAHGTTVAFAVRVGQAVAALAFTVLVTRLLGPVGSGRYFLAFTVFNIAVALARVGLDNPLLRLTASHASAGEWPQLFGVYQVGIEVAAAAAVAASVVILVSAEPLARLAFHDPGLADPIRIMGLGVLPGVLCNLYSEMLKGLKRIFASQYVAGLGIMLAALLLLALVRGSTPATVSRVYVGASCITAFTAIVLWRRFTPRDVALVRYPVRQLLESSTPLVWATSLVMIGGWTATIVLGATRGPHDVGTFGAASRAALSTTLMLTAVNSISAPKFAALFREQRIEAVEDLARKTAVLMTLVVSPIFLTMVIAPGWVMQFFGKAFVDGAPALAILAAGQFVNVATGSVGYLLLMSGRERIVRDNIAVSATATVALDFVLIPRFGVLGAAIATSLGVVVLNLRAAWLVHRHLGISPLPLVPRVHLVPPEPVLTSALPAPEFDTLDQAP